jgi:CBS domain-containing protein
MTRSPGPEPNPRTLHEEAAAAAVRDTGPAPDRYYNALLNYLQAMSHDRLAARPDPALAWPDPAPRPRPATLVGDVMTEAVVTAHEDAVFKEIVAALARNKIRAVPVIDDNRKVIGVVSASDLLHRVVAGPGTRPRTRGAAQSAHADTAAELMTTPAVTTRPHATIVEAAQRAAHARVRTLPVVDANGVLVGIVTQGDLLRVFLRDDDAIRDEIQQYASRTLHIEPGRLSLDVTEGVVTVSGRLERQLQVAQLINRIRAVPGVVDIDNQLTARFDDRYFPAPHDARQ